MEKLSVALCTYNGAEFLSKQLESIKQQTMSIHEMVVCDDGSSDETLAILDRFSKQVAFPYMYIAILKIWGVARILNNV